MCEPITLGVAATAATSSTAATAATAGLFGVGGAFSAMTTLGTLASVASVGMGVMGAMGNSQAQQDQSAYQAGVARNNKIIADRNAATIKEQGTREANRYRSRVRGMIADQTINLVGGGDVSTGSTVDLLADTAEFGEMDAQTIEANAADGAYNAKVQGNNFGNQANLYKAQSESQNPLFSGVSSLMSGAGTVAHRWSMRKN